MRFKLLVVFLGIASVSMAQLPKIENNQLVLEGTISFKTGTNELTDEAKTRLQQVKEFLVAKDYVTTLRVEGHSDNTGNAHESQSGSEQRALAVCRWLISSGIDCKRLVAVGFGGTKPIESNATPEGRARNNRIGFVIAALRGKLIGGTPADGGGVIAGDPCLP
jgi:OOP family OmpA-OmpF porin